MVVVVVGVVVGVGEKSPGGRSEKKKEKTKSFVFKKNSDYSHRVQLRVDVCDVVEVGHELPDERAVGQREDLGALID